MLHPDPLLILLQLSDSALPIGSYSHSWGLETAVQAGQIRSASQTLSYLQGILRYSIGPLEGRSCALAYDYGRDQGEERFWQMQDRLNATRWAPEPRRASLALGHRLNQLSGNVWGITCPSRTGERSGPHHCLAFGWIGAQAGVDRSETVRAYLFSSITSLVSAAVRLVPLGHTQGQQILAQIQPQILEILPQCLGSDPLSSFAPLQERDCQIHQQLYSRLFQS